jgi:Domain of unknown function (DUF4157)
MSRGYAPLEKRPPSSQPAPARPLIDRVTRSPGKPLDDVTRSQLGPGFAIDLSRVRVHTDGEAAESARSVNALAWTHGEHIGFDTGRYAPGTTDGRALLAHELTHVAQQQRSGPQLQRRPPDGTPNDGLGGQDEFEARLVEQQLKHGAPLPYKQAVALNDCVKRLGEDHIRDCQQTLGLPVSPAPPRFNDPRVRVLPADKPQLAKLIAFLVDSRSKIGTLVGGGPSLTTMSKETWMDSSNPNVSETLAELDTLIAELQGEQLIVRFDQATGGVVAASYTFSDNIVHLRPFTSDTQRNQTAASLLHEYTHAQQDRATEAKLTASNAPVEHTAEQELQQEIGGRKPEVYYVRMLMCIIHSPLNDPLGAELTAMVLTGDFERMRTGSKAEKAAGKADVRKTIGDAYQSQIAANAPSRNYVVEIDDSDQATLYTSGAAGGGKIDLGQVPPGTKTRNDLVTLFGNRIPALKDFAKLFVGAGGKTMPVITCTAVWHGQVVAELDFAKP